MYIVKVALACTGILAIATHEITELSKGYGIFNFCKDSIK